MACSAATIEEAVKPEKRQLYDQLMSQFLATNKDPFSSGYDQRTPGE
jgi:hypothetical protein